VGSPSWIAPEQVVGVRGDPRSDLFALGVILYELATGELPFGNPQTTGGLRQRLWMKPAPPQRYRPDLPDSLQEIILRCLQAQADDRYPSAAHLSFDLRHPEQVQIRGLASQGLSLWSQFKRWIWAAGQQYHPSALPAQQQIQQVPIVMVAIPHEDVSEATLYSLRSAATRSLGNRPGARLAVVTVLSPNASSSTDSARSETTLHRQHLTQLQRWAQGLDLSAHQASFHVLESGDVAKALLNYAEGNQVDLIIMGAATHGLQFQRLIATVPIKVAMDAPCTVMLVKAERPFELLGSEES
jgi:serine/threonine protein kinase